jgi:hypothetical protein
LQGHPIIDNNHNTSAKPKLQLAVIKQQKNKLYDSRKLSVLAWSKTDQEDC